VKVAKLYNFYDIRIEDIPIPEVGPGDALMKTKASGICSGDVMPWYIEKKAPLVLGHEPSGEIADVGKKVSSFKKGDRVFVHHHAPCFTCRQCKRGDYVQCDTWRKTVIMPGGISEYILIPEINLENDTLNLPDTLSYEEGTLIEPIACVIKALKRANIRHGDIVLIIGLGVMGMLNGIIAKKYAAAKIIGTDSVDFRLHRALELGFDAVIDISQIDSKKGLQNITGRETSEIVIVCPNSIDALTEGLSLTGQGGSLVMFTPVKPDELITVNPNELYFKDINIVTSYSCGPTDTADALKLLEEGTVKAEKIITHRFPIEKTEEAFRLTAEASDSLKSIIVFD
jgi:L-iditol 2-dehydrogenase